MSELKTKTNFSDNQIVIIFSILIITAILFRVIIFPYDLPIPQDGQMYFWYANDMSLTNSIPDTNDGYFPNTLWPIFLSLFFSSLSSDNVLEYMELQREITVGLSIITAIPIFFLCRKFVKQEYALIGTTLFLFEPRLIENSLGGLTEPLFLLLSVCSITLFVGKRMSLTYISFIVLALATLTRYEAALLIIPFTILFVLKNKNFRKISQLIICIVIFFMIVIPVDNFRSSNSDIDTPGVFDHVFAAVLVYESRMENECVIDVIENDCVRTIKSEGRQSNIEDYTLFQTINASIINLAKYFGWITFPLFFIFLPMGVYRFLVNRNFEKWTIILCMIFMLFPAFYAFSRDFQEIRYLYIQIPLLCVIASLSIEYFSEKTVKPKTIMTIFLSGIIFTSVIFYYEQSSEKNYELEREYFEISKKINLMMNTSNEIFPADKYIRSAKIAGLDKFPVLRNSFDLFSFKMISNNEHDSLQELIQFGKENDLKHLVIDSDGDGIDYLSDIFTNENEYPFLEKIYDSNVEGFTYHVKFFKINYDVFNTYYGFEI